MNSIQRTFVIATGIALVGAASTAFAGVNAGMMDQLNSRDSSSQSSAPAYSPPPSSSSSSSSSSSAPSYSSAPAMSSAPQPNYRNSSSNVGRQPAQVRSQPAPQSAPGPRSAAPAAAPAESRPNYRNSGQLYTSPSTTVRPQAASGQQSGARGNEAQSNSNIGRRSGGVVGGALSRNYPNGNQGNNNGGGGHHNPGNPGNPGNPDDDGDHHHPRPPRVVYTLPPSYYDYYYGGNLYYNFGGGWYTPYGSSYLSVGAPYGLFMTSLPGYTTSFDYDDTRYYLREDTYYTYDRSRGGYVVTPSPYGDEEDDYEDAVDEDIYVYPAQGQSEKQQADDRYACHRWGVKESGYDPIDDAFDPDRRANYTRALTACLTGRGYSVK